MKFLLPTVALSIFAISVMAFIATAAPIQAHFQSYDSVNDCEIRYEEETQYDTARVAGELLWEAIMGSDNCVNIAPDNSDTSTDLVAKDVNKQNVTWAGYYNWWPVLKDRIRYNEYYMKDYGSCKKTFVAGHEWGHAQRLDHSESGNIMQDTVANRCVLGDHGKSDYREQWGN